MNERKIEVKLSSRFLKDLRRLERKYRHVRDDVKPLIVDLKNGATPGDQLQRLGKPVYKVRIPNTDAQRGKSGGYRVLYYVRTVENIYLVAIYSKTEHEDISDDSIASAIEDILSTLNTPDTNTPD